MIGVAMHFLVDEINQYLHSKLSFQGDKVVLDNVARLDNSGSNTENRIVLSLVNIEEERLYKNPENFTRTDDNKVVYSNPAVPINMYCVFAYNHGNNDNESVNHYEEGLMYISYIIQFFQHRQVFTPQNSPALDPGIEKLIADLHSLGFEQLNHLWAILGGKYLPSVMYKFRLVVIDERLQQGSGELVRNVGVNNN
ncbi:MAG: DUF4255 domain-containing protein [Chitinophagaceae bacterium]